MLKKHQKRENEGCLVTNKKGSTLKAKPKMK
jgi:hypothetical protein